VLQLYDISRPEGGTKAARSAAPSRKGHKGRLNLYPLPWAVPWAEGFKLFRFLETTNGMAVCTVVVARRVDVATVKEVQVVGVVAIRTTRPIAAVVTDTVEGTIAVGQTTCGRIPNG